MKQKHLEELQDGSLVKYNGELLWYYEYVYDAGLYSLMGALKHTFTAGFILNKMQPVRLYEKFTINGEEVYVWQVLGFGKGVKKEWCRFAWAAELNIPKQCLKIIFEGGNIYIQQGGGTRLIGLELIKYAHQVQALYRILTGKPLKLKLKIPKSK